MRPHLGPRPRARPDRPGAPRGGGWRTSSWPRSSTIGGPGATSTNGSPEARRPARPGQVPGCPDALGLRGQARPPLLDEPRPTMDDAWRATRPSPGDPPHLPRGRRRAAPSPTRSRRDKPRSMTMSTTTRTRKTRKTAPAPHAGPGRPGPNGSPPPSSGRPTPAPWPSPGGPPRGPLPPEWIARRAGWLARHVDPAFDPETIAAAALRDFNDRRFLALLPGPALSLPGRARRVRGGIHHPRSRRHAWGILELPGYDGGRNPSWTCGGRDDARDEGEAACGGDGRCDGTPGDGLSRRPRRGGSPRPGTPLAAYRGQGQAEAEGAPFARGSES